MLDTQNQTLVTLTMVHVNVTTSQCKNVIIWPCHAQVENYYLSCKLTNGKMHILHNR
jgi:hypothetical protein